MNTPNEKELTRLLLQHIMSCTVLAATSTSYNIPDLRELAIPINWPIAFWNTDVDVWMMDTESADWPVCFDPLHDLSDAWLVLHRFYEEHPDGELFSSLAYHLGVTFASPEGYKIFQMDLEQLVSLTPRKICIAVLKTIPSVSSATIDQLMKEG